MRTTIITALAAVGSMATLASGQVIASFSYENLSSDFVLGSQTLTTGSTGASSGSFTRLEAPGGSATFGAGFADFNLSLLVSNITLAGADGDGAIVLTDVDGDTLTADLTGTFVVTPIGAGLVNLTYSGALSNVFFNDTGAGGSSLDGSTGSASTAFGASEPYIGALVQLTIANVNVFQSDWFGKFSEVDAQIIVPAPASVALLGLGGLVATRRRR